LPGVNETLRVNGKDRITTDPALLEPLAVNGKAPRSGILITAEEVYFHCGKALIRSDLWNPEKHLPKGQWPSLGRIIAAQLGSAPPRASRRRRARARASPPPPRATAPGFTDPGRLRCGVRGGAPRLLPCRGFASHRARPLPLLCRPGDRDAPVPVRHKRHAVF